VAVEKYTGTISGKVAKPPVKRAGVWLTREGLSAPKTPKQVILEQKEYQFGESLLVVPRGTEVFFPNEDPDYHNVYSLSRPKRFDLGRYKMGEKPVPSMFFDQLGLIDVRCEIHEHMRALVLVVESPYVGTTDEKGGFELRGVAPGTYVLHVQLDKKTQWERKISVTAGRSVQVQPKRLKK
jgi:plastocyanin